jgi:hypothetical protein
MTERPEHHTAPDGRTRPRQALRVDVPDARRGRALAERIAPSELARTAPESWAVVGSADGDLPQILGTIQQWLRDEDIEQTTVYLGDRPHTMTRD